MELQQKYGRDIPVTVLIGSIRDKSVWMRFLKHIIPLWCSMRQHTSMCR